jgi:hypothetical protein
MTHAPEKLWVDPTGVDDLDMYIAHASDTMDYLNMDVSYTRTDIADARVKNLEEAFEAGYYKALQDAANLCEGAGAFADEMSPYILALKETNK